MRLIPINDRALLAANEIHYTPQTLYNYWHRQKWPAGIFIKQGRKILLDVDKFQTQILGLKAPLRKERQNEEGPTPTVKTPVQMAFDFELNTYNSHGDVIGRKLPADLVNRMIKEGWFIDVCQIYADGRTLFVLAHKNEGNNTPIITNRKPI